jgi:hypothetical protein
MSRYGHPSREGARHRLKAAFDAIQPHRRPPVEPPVPERYRWLTSSVASPSAMRRAYGLLLSTSGTRLRESTHHARRGCRCSATSIRYS